MTHDHETQEIVLLLEKKFQSLPSIIYAHSRTNTKFARYVKSRPEWAENSSSRENDRQSTLENPFEWYSWILVYNFCKVFDSALGVCRSPRPIAAVHGVLRSNRMFPMTKEIGWIGRNTEKSIKVHGVYYPLKPWINPWIEKCPLKPLKMVLAPWKKSILFLTMYFHAHLRRSPVNFFGSLRSPVITLLSSG